MMPFLITLGLTPERCECVSGLILSLQGNGITVSQELSRLGVSSGLAMRQQMWRDRGKKIYTFGVSYPLSSQYALLCQWLRSPKAPHYIDVRIESVPPEQLFPLLKLGYLDGFCAGEPWNSVAVQAGVANYVASARPEEAARALSSIEATSRGALGEMRRLLDFLRDGDPTAPELGPAHRLADLGPLLTSTAEAGVQVHLEVRGSKRDLPPGADLAAYRIVQESLTNVVKHAHTATCRVVVTYEHDAVLVEITDNGRAAPPGAVTTGPGHGIAGMRERAGLYGGEFDAGPLPGGGFRVAARLPLDSAPGEPAKEPIA